jgi:hypothetical protein
LQTKEGEISLSSEDRFSALTVCPLTVYSTSSQLSDIAEFERNDGAITKKITSTTIAPIAALAHILFIL